MTTSAAVLARDDRRFAVEYSPEAPVGAGTRQIALKTSGRRHGPITRLVSPSDIGELIKPFVFLDHAEIAPRSCTAPTTTKEILMNPLATTARGMSDRASTESPTRTVGATKNILFKIKNV